MKSQRRVSFIYWCEIQYTRLFSVEEWITHSICFGICLGIVECELDFAVANSKQDKLQSTQTQRSETHHCSPESLHIIVQRTKWFSGERCHWITRCYFIFHSDLYTSKAPDKVNETKWWSAEVKRHTSLIRLFPEVAPKIPQNCKTTMVTTKPLAWFIRFLQMYNVYTVTEPRWNHRGLQQPSELMHQ